MSLIHGQGKVGTDGELRIPVPPTLRGRDVEYTLDVQPAMPARTNGAGPRKELSQEEWRQLVNETAGSMPDFPDIERPGPDTYEKRLDF